MKIFTLIISCCLIAHIGLMAQNAPIDFESTGNGATWTWTTFENGANPALEIINNPDATGINTSAKVAKFTALQVGQPWAGFHSQHGADIGTFTLSASNSTIKIKVWKTVISDVAIKFATASDASSGEIKVANTVTNAWEELTFDFSSKIGEPSSTGIDQIIIFPDFNLAGRTGDNITYIDNITFSAQVSAPTEPTTAATTPTRPQGNVISLFSNAYTNVPVNTWRTDWSAAQLTELQVAGDDVKKYTSLDFVGVETTGANMIDASSMLYFHLDVWTPNMTAFRVKLVDFGADGAFAGGDDKEHEITFTPTLSGWNSYEIPLTDFTGLTTKAHIAQLIFSGTPAGTGTAYVDNVYFHNVAATNPSEPATAAATPTRPQGNVISLFSNAYTNVPVNTWRTDWSAAQLTELQVAGDDVKKYTSLDFVGVETTGANMIDASSMLYFHVDVWTPNMTAFRVKLVDFGADGAFGGGDDKEHEITFTPTLSGWNSYEIPLTDFAGLTTKAHIAQLIFSGTPAGTGTAYVDNVYFHNVSANPNEPSTAAATPTRPSGNVISLFSNAYTNVPVNTWRTDWSAAQLTELQVAGDDVKKYTSLDYVGVETTGANMINASTMLYFHVDVWTPNMTAFRVKLVDFGADGGYAGGDDKEHEITLTPTLSGWNYFEIPLSDFTGLTTQSHIAQLIFSGLPAGSGTAYIDNVYFHNVSSGNSDEPSVAAATPTRPGGNVISLFSNAYTNVPVTTWRTDWSVAQFQDVQVAGNDTKKYSSLDYVGIETTGANMVDASSMLYFHVDVWTPNMTTFRIKLVDFGADGGFGGGDDKEHEVSFTPTIKGWNNYEIPLTDFTGLTTKSHIAQIILSGNPAGSGTAFIDNMYFHNVAPAALPTLPLDFESTSVAYSFTDFAGGAITVLANPQSNGINTSTRVGKMIKSSGQTYGGSFISLASPIDFSVGKTFKVKVFMPRVGAKLLLKVENASNGSIAFEKEATGTVANQWEELSFDYGSINTANQYQKVVLIFDLGTMGDGTANFTYLFDDIRLVSGGGPTLTQMNLPVTFDDATVEYGLVGFGGADQSTVETDPTDANNKVAKVIKTNSAETWAGTTITASGQLGFSSKIPFTESNKKMSVRVWSPDAGITVRLKVEEHGDNTKSVETDATTTAANAWQILTFDFANHVNGTAALNLSYNYDKASIFFNFGVAGSTAGEKIYYFDDVKFGEVAVTEQTITFPAIPDKTLGNPAFTLTATASSNLVVSYSTDSDKVTISGSTVTLVKAGRVIITANQSGNGSFSPASPVERSFCIKPATPTITTSGANTEEVTITSSSTVGNQWFLNGSPITNATNNTLSVTEPGIYQVQVKADDCLSELSAEAVFIITGDLKYGANPVRIYPNPAERYLHVHGLKDETFEAQLIDLTGKSIKVSFERHNDSFRAEAGQFAPGLYVLTIQQGGAVHKIKVIKK